LLLRVLFGLIAAGVVSPARIIQSLLGLRFDLLGLTGLLNFRRGASRSTGRGAREAAG
jgi:hypothetical protein